MNNKIKVALAFAAGGALFLLSKKRRKNQKSKTFTAPDENEYRENQMYRTSNGKLFKNGKEISFSTPYLDNDSQPVHHQDDHLQNNYQSRPKNVEYHQKGNRHR